MSRSRFLPTALLTALVALAILLPASSQALDLGGHDRDGVVVGVVMGPGWNKMEFSIPDADGNLQTFKTGNSLDFAGGLNVGWARSDHLVGSLGVYGWKEAGWALDIPVSATTFHFLAEASWFPNGQGFWLKGGVGAGTLDFSAVTPAQRVTYQKGGWNFNAGAGYEFRVADTVAFGFAYDYRFMTVGNFEGLEDTKIHSQVASFSFRYYAD